MSRRLAALALLAALAACQEKATPKGIPVEGSVGTNPGLGADVEVIYDGLGVPHIYASSDGDGAYALGYVHARDRLFQMDFYRRAGHGRLSELLGEATLEQDVALRTIFTGIRKDGLGNWEVGRVEDFIAQELATTDAIFHAVLQRYVDGVNRYLEDMATGKNGARVPVEYLAILGGPPGPQDIPPWTVQDALAFGRLLTWDLSFDADADVAFGRAAQALGCTAPAPTFGCALLADLTRSAPAVNSFVLPPQAPPALLTVLPAAGAAAGLGQVAARLGSLSGLFGPERAASNNWVVAGTRTATGRPLLANDPHLGLENPSIFYLAHLVTPSRDVAGVTFAGAPVVPIGHNGKVAWGATVAGYDVSDVFIEVLPTPGDPTAVLYQGTPHATVMRPETFGVRGGMTGCPAPCTVTVTIPVVPWHGPILSVQGSVAYSVQWTGQSPSQEVLAFWQLNGATKMDEALQALNYFEVGAQNFVLADTAGEIAYDPHARVPTHPAGCAPWAPQPGWDGSCDWSGRVGDAALPHDRNPAAGWLATANNDITGSTADNNPLDPLYLYYTRDLGYRHARVAQRLTEKAGGYTLDDMTAIQADVHSLFAEAMVPALLAWWSSADCSATDTSGVGDCATSIADLEATTGLKLTEAVSLLTAWGAAGPQQYRTPTGLATSNPAGAASASTAERQAAAASMLFHALVPRLARLILDDELGAYGYSVNTWLESQLVAKYLAALGGYARGKPPAVPLVTETTPPLPSLCMGPRTDTCADAAVLALQEAVAFLTGVPAFGAGATPADWLWGRLHRATFRSRLSSATSLFDYGPFANDGGLYTVDVANFSWSNDGAGGFTQGSGPNVRFGAQVEPSSIRWRAVIPGGQSAYPGDANYMDQIPAWLANQPGDQPYARGEVEAAASRRLIFTP